MQTDPLLFFRIASLGGLFICIFATWLVVKNSQRLFAPDASIPSETASARSYSQFLVYAVLAHAFIFCSSGALFL